MAFCGVLPTRVLDYHESKGQLVILQASISRHGFGNLVHVQQTDITECLHIVDMATDHLEEC